MKLVILTRDIVITHNPTMPVESAEGWVPVAGSLEAVARLANAGYHIVAIAPRSGPAGGLSIEALNRIHEKMYRLAVEAGGLIEAIFFNAGAGSGADLDASCFGMLEEIRRRLKTSLQGIPVIGVDERDFQAVRRMGATPVLVRLGTGETPAAETMTPAATALIFDDLAATADYILAQPDTVRQ